MNRLTNVLVCIACLTISNLSANEGLAKIPMSFNKIKLEIGQDRAISVLQNSKKDILIFGILKRPIIQALIVN